MQPTTHPTALRVQQFGRDLGLDITVVEFNESTRTAAAAAAAVGCDVGQIVKTLVFLVAGDPVICLVSGRNRLDERKLAAWMGVGRKKVRRADAEQVRQTTAYAIGGVAPFGYPRQMALLMDQDLMQYDVVWAAAGTPNAVFAVSPPELRRGTQAHVTDICRPIATLQAP
ncbi:MAG: YbaK/EbsC family protein [Chloroflexi bacterium]|nr:YbaK/EbsC family protein [Chloroflexota bacterium]